MKYKILILVNPKAGKAKITKDVPKIKDNLEKLNYDVGVVSTFENENATSIIKKYEKDYDILIVCGGDGTLNETIQGLCEIEKKVFIGYIPLGTTNDFGKSLKVSFDKLDISKQINEYEDKQVDLGVFNERIFIYSAAFGIFSKSSYKTSLKWKNRIGRFAYIISAIKEIFNYRTYKLKIKTKEKNIEDEFIYGSISNSQYVGGFNMFKNKKVELDDGKFEIILVKKPKNFINLLRLIYKVLTGNLDDKNIYYFQTAELSIDSEDDIEWSIDGENGGINNKVNIYNLNKFMNFIVPSIDEKLKS